MTNVAPLNFNKPGIDITNAQLALDHAFSLPPRCYTDPETYRLEIDAIFRSQWLCVGRLDQISEVGDYFSMDLMDEKLLIVRDSDESIRVQSRVCRHRSAELVTSAGNTRKFICPYHAWTYRLDGTLAGAPLMEKATNFKPDRCRLHGYRHEIWMGWIFVNLDGTAQSLIPRLAPLATMLANYRLEDMVAQETATYESPFNWKVLVDNFMEAYHHIAIHRDTFEPIYPARASFVEDTAGPYSVLKMPIQPSIDPAVGGVGLPGFAELTQSERNQLVAVAVFPCHLFAPTGGSLVWYHILPRSHDQFTLKIYACLPRQTLDDPQYAQAIGATNELVKHVHSEDIMACNAVWQGINTRSARPGRLSQLEKSLWQFNQWWIELMGSASTSYD